MPLRCIDENGNDVEADSLDERGWRKIENTVICECPVAIRK